MGYLCDRYRTTFRACVVDAGLGWKGTPWYPARTQRKRSSAHFEACQHACRVGLEEKGGAEQCG